MRLDSTWGRGVDAVGEQTWIAHECARCWHATVHHTPLGAAHVDCVFSRGGIIQSVAEIRSRSITLPELRAHGSYIVTAAKIDRARAVGDALGVRALLVVGLVDGSIVWFRLSEPGAVRYTTRRTRTRANCNGDETTVRLNAYLDLRDMKLL